jgi:hypothetical protein
MAWTFDFLFWKESPGIAFTVHGYTQLEPPTLYALSELDILFFLDTFAAPIPKIKGEALCQKVPR